MLLKKNGKRISLIYQKSLDNSALYNQKESSHKQYQTTFARGRNAR